MKKQIIIIISISVIILVLFHIRHFYKTIDKYEIIQMEYYDRNKYENNIQQKIPLIIRNFKSVINIEQLHEIQTIIGDNITELYLSPPFLGNVNKTNVKK